MRLPKFGVKLDRNCCGVPIAMLSTSCCYRIGCRPFGLNVCSKLIYLTKHGVKDCIRYCRQERKTSLAWTYLPYPLMSPGYVMMQFMTVIY